MTIGMFFIIPLSLLIWFGVEASPTNPFYLRWLALLPTVLWIAIFLPDYLLESLRRSRMRKFATLAGFEYLETPLNVDGYDITVGSVIAQGGGTNGYASLLCGVKDEHTFRAIDYAYQHGKGNDSQTIICIDLKDIGLTEFSIINKGYLLIASAPKVNKVVCESYAKRVPKNYTVVVDGYRKNDLLIPSGFLDEFANNKSFNAEYLGDRLLVYRYCKKLVGNDFLKALDYAVTLAEKCE